MVGIGLSANEHGAHAPASLLEVVTETEKLAPDASEGEV